MCGAIQSTWVYTLILVACVNAAGASITCPSGSHNVTALDHFQTRGVYAQYYPNYVDTIANGEHIIPKLSAIHYDRVEPILNIEGLTKNNAALKGGLPNPELFHYSAPIMEDRIYARFLFRFIAPCDGEYKFRTSADDGAILTINGVRESYDWSGHPEQQFYTDKFTFTAGSVRSVMFEYFEGTGHMVVRLQWKPPGASDYSVVPSEYLVPAMGPEVLVTTHNTITIDGKAEVQYFEARLSEKPLQTVYVDIGNEAGADIFGVDKCVLIFTPENWETPQTVHVAPILGTTSTRKVEGTMWITLKPRYNKEIAPGGVAVIDPATSPQSSGSRAQCTGWGDPHYTMFDGKKFDLYEQGMFTLARDYTGDFGVQTYLIPCDEIGAKVTCTYLGFLVYKGTKIQFRMNPGESHADIWDPTVFVDILEDNNNGVSMVRNSDNNVVFNLPNGMSVKCTTGFYRKERQDGNHWRYLNFYIEAPTTMYEKLTGMCGLFDGSSDGETTNPSEIADKWLVTDESEWIIYGDQQPISPTPTPRPDDPTGPTSGYTPPITMDAFEFADGCNPNTAPNEPLPSSGSGSPITPRTLNSTYEPIEDPEPTDEVVNACKDIINSGVCESMSDDDILGFVEGCAIDTTLAELDVPPPEAAEPFLEACSFEEKKDACNQCTSLQQCDMATNTCVTVASSCGVGCGEANGHGTCDESNSVCDCTEDYTGIHCESPLEPCKTDPCLNGGICSNEALQTTCECVDGYQGVRCEQSPACQSAGTDESTGKVYKLEVYTECIA
ncbi:hypothetical protein SARC_05249 [Sphaeroforma arctica JP610]|uniref:PA14 domain-containing protein n=1 Tax=Sphaeroforma arctica JP610 TaxID=667725 RepID=A0A0L0G016_9EUKA|nr:hypothetical protein SARC_05249 [Sphaeroforma arctica JP610]KNC82457.1 hypothetical protein SARC_05249 [Sphaeroforma arctica JP610]|eukprot:XP_014156359.1 hypothetical protein SARC_05249 [Sphaeroforma arctica JP610]